MGQFSLLILSPVPHPGPLVQEQSEEALVAINILFFVGDLDVYNLIWSLLLYWEEMHTIQVIGFVLFW